MDESGSESDEESLPFYAHPLSLDSSLQDTYEKSQVNN